MTIYKASYTKSENPIYEGNPLIESLRPQLGIMDFFQALILKPLDRSKLENLSEITRHQYVTRLKFDFFVPYTRHFQLYEAINTAISNGYVSRNPLKRSGNPLTDDYRNIVLFDTDYELSYGGRSFGTSLIGPSGVGKSTAVNRILMLYPPAIIHEDYKITQIPVIRIDCPLDGSIKQLCLSFFSAIDFILNDSKYEKYSSRRFTVEDLVDKMAKTAISHNIGCLVIDEIQQLSEAKAQGAQRMMDFLVKLNNAVKIPLVFIGTNKSLDVLQKSFKIARRGSESGAFIWENISYGREFEIITKELFKYQYILKPLEWNQEINDYLFEVSQGILDRLLRIFIFSQQQAILTKGEELSIKLMKYVEKDRLWLEKPMMDALKSGDKNRIQVFDDIYFSEKFNYIKSVNPVNKEILVFQKLAELDITREGSEKLVNYFLDLEPLKDPLDIAFLVIKELNALKLNPKKVIKSPALKKSYSEGDLRKIDLGEDVNQLHQILSEAGILRPPLEEFKI